MNSCTVVAGEWNQYTGYSGEVFHNAVPLSGMWQRVLLNCNLAPIQYVLSSGGMWICNKDGFNHCLYRAYRPQSPYMMSVSDYKGEVSLNDSNVPLLHNGYVSITSRYVQKRSEIYIFKTFLNISKHFRLPWRCLYVNVSHGNTFFTLTCKQTWWRRSQDGVVCAHRGGNRCFSRSN